MTRSYHHPNGEFEVVTFVSDTATARAFYANATEVTIASAQTGQAAAAATRPRVKTPFDKLVDLMEADGILTKQKADTLRGT